ncbi:PleD family two-component system response regulator [Streptomyces sp. NPDC101151]|uniref:response regulator n=1 Tax=Streptomyces sp. NPDC101151 TaxID=3366115 RepID=UPI00380A150E
MTRRRAQVLVVDDDRISRLMLTYRLELAGLETAMCDNGRQALKLLRQAPFDLVLLDILMPDMDGYSTLEVIKKDSRLRDTPIVMISSLGEMDSVVRCLELGAEDYMPKPLDALLLSTRVNAILLKAELRELRKEFQQVTNQLADAAAQAVHGRLPVEEIAELLNREDVGRLAQEILRLATATGIPPTRLS